MPFVSKSKQSGCDEDHECDRNIHEGGRDMVDEGKMRIKNETKVASSGSRRNRVTITENKSWVVDFI